MKIFDMIIRSIMMLVIVSAALSASSVSASIVIDTYSVGTTIVQLGTGTATQTTNHGSIFGGSGDETLTVTDQGGAEFIGVIGFGGGLHLAQGSSDRINGSLVYDNFTGIDLTEAGMNDKFLIRVANSDSLTTLTDAFSITVRSGAASSLVLFDIPPGSAVPGWVQIDFAGFAGVDMTSVDSIELGFDFQDYPGTDLSINRFFVSNAIPEPATGMVVAGIALLLTRRRLLI